MSRLHNHPLVQSALVVQHSSQQKRLLQTVSPSGQTQLVPEQEPPLGQVTHLPPQQVWSEGQPTQVPLLALHARH